MQRRRSITQQQSPGPPSRSPVSAAETSEPTTVLEEFYQIIKGNGGHHGNGMSRPQSRTSPRRTPSAMAQLFTSPPSRNWSRNPFARTTSEVETLIAAQRHLLQLLSGQHAISPPPPQEFKDDDVESLSLGASQLDLTDHQTA